MTRLIIALILAAIVFTGLAMSFVAPLVWPRRGDEPEGDDIYLAREARRALHPNGGDWL